MDDDESPFIHFQTNEHGDHGTFNDDDAEDADGDNDDADEDADENDNGDGDDDADDSSDSHVTLSLNVGLASIWECLFQALQPNLISLL